MKDNFILHKSSRERAFNDLYALSLNEYNGLLIATMTHWYDNTAVYSKSHGVYEWIRQQQATVNLVYSKDKLLNGKEIKHYPSKYKVCNDIQYVRVVKSTTDIKHFVQTLIDLIKAATSCNGRIYVMPMRIGGKTYNYVRSQLQELSLEHNEQSSDYQIVKLNDGTEDIELYDSLERVVTWQPREWNIHSIIDSSIKDPTTINILNNLEDTEQLLYRIYKQTEVCRKLYRHKDKLKRIQEDF